ncbi:MAG: FAD-binding oxidoreductase [Desulfobacterales bacterium]|nr:FAD-binding oxidoreductase [Desulfobacterales bacterium]
MGPLPSRAEVVIIGGGIIGVSIAYYLAKKGAGKVVLLERGIMGEGSTGKCAGGIRTQFSTEINIRFSLLSLKVFEGFQAEFGVDPEFHPVGYLFLAAHERQWQVLNANAQLMQTMGLGVELLDPDEIRRRWPFLRVDDLLGGSYTKGDGYAGPYEVLQGFAKGARRLGAMLREGTEVTGIQVKKGRVQAVEVATGERVVTPVVINAAGPYAGQVAAMVGLDLPVRPVRRQLFFTDPFQELPSCFPLVIDLEHGWYMRREGEGLLLAGPQDAESSFNERVDFEAQEWTAARSLHRVPILERARIVRGWAGLYDISPDHHAIVGPFPEIRGFICANGFSGHGFQHSPAVGILVAELIAEGQAKTIDIYPLRPQRFREGDLIYEPLTAFRD